MPTSRNHAATFCIHAGFFAILAATSLVHCGSPVVTDLRRSAVFKPNTAELEQLSLTSTGLPYRGVSLAGAEFSPTALPGTAGSNYF